jgi:hypothetical protein
MRIDLPKWTEGRHIYILAGIELAARKTGPDWETKVSRCSHCGQCCMNVPDGWPEGRNNKTGNCKHLIFTGKDWMCDYGGDRPFSCCISDGERTDCAIKWKTV